MILILLNIPFTRDLNELQQELEQTLREYLERGFDPYLRVTCDYERLRLHIDGMVSIEREGRRAAIHTRSGEIYRCYLSLQQLEERLPAAAFVRISGGTIINVRYLLRLRPYEVILQEAGRRTRREISRRRYWQLQERLRRMAPALEE